MLPSPFLPRRRDPHRSWFSSSRAPWSPISIVGLTPRSSPSIFSHSRSNLGSSPSSPSPPSSSARPSPAPGDLSSAPPPSPTPTHRPATPFSYCGDCPTMSARAYLPSTDSWIDFRFPQPISTLPTTGTSLLADFDRDQCIVNPFSPPHPVHILPPLPRLHRPYCVLALIQDNPSDYIVVAIGITKRAKCIYSQTYDSRSGRWEERGHLLLGRGSVERRSAVYLDGLLFCLSRPANRLLTFNPVGGQWSMVHLDLPVPYVGYLLFGFGGELCVTGFLREGTVISGIGTWELTGIGIWELDRLTMTWKEFDFMPGKYFTEFSDRGRRSLSMVECKGMVCFFSLGTKEIVMCDLAVRRWWRPQPCNIPGERGLSIGCAIEPHINLLT